MRERTAEGLEPVLAVNDLSRSFGALTALDGVALEVAPGQVLGLVGPNGSGKTTLINVVSGLYKPDRGAVVLGGRQVTGWAPHRLARMGLNRTFQIPRPFKDLTVLENLAVAHRHAGGGVRTAQELLATVGIAGMEHRRASELNASQQKRLDLARAVTTGPKVLLVDELGAGLGPGELDEMAVMLTELASTGMAMIVVEHLLGFLAKLTETVVVLNAGSPIFTGSLQAATQDPEVVKVFLGGA
ncbi:MAG: ABC transporter ATP-binding protein [Actinomycetota bacterium]|nr:ABC transporter ATP-binding protein [Actinomycetota bacterium]